VSVFTTTGTVTPSANSRCVKWVASEQVRQTRVRSYVDQLPPCPCSGFQALFTPAYSWITGTDCFATVDKSIVNTNGTIVGMVSSSLTLLLLLIADKPGVCTVS
jgi:hypothetical protein